MRGYPLRVIKISCLQFRTDHSRRSQFTQLRITQAYVLSRTKALRTVSARSAGRTMKAKLTWLTWVQHAAYIAVRGRETVMHLFPLLPFPFLRISLQLLLPWPSSSLFLIPFRFHLINFPLQHFPFVHARSASLSLSPKCISSVSFTSFFSLVKVLPSCKCNALL